MSMNATIPDILAPDVVLVLDGEDADRGGRLLDMAGQFHALSPVAARMLQLTLAEGRDQAARQIAAEYGVAESQVRGDLDTFLADLARQGFLGQGRRGARPAIGRVLALLQVPALLLVRFCVRSIYLQAVLLLALARLSFALFGWTNTVRVWARVLHSRGGAAVNEEQLVSEVDGAIRRAAAGLVLTAECKERGLCCWSLLRLHGVGADLVVGLSLYPTGGHCWCEAGTRTLSDDLDRCQTYTPVLRYC
jgi:hypothetical protein